MARTFLYLLAAAIIAATGLIQGFATGRWAASSDLQDAAARIHGIPATIGEWAGRPSDADPREMESAGIAGALLSRYANARTGRAVTVLLVCGRPGPISVHTPDICYSGAGYAMAAEPMRMPPGPGQSPWISEFSWADFDKQNAIAPDRLRIGWAWFDGDAWASPGNPRLAYASRRYLYKLYVIRQANEPLGPGEAEPSAAFLGEFLPEVARALSQGQGGRQASAGHP
jgi:Protein of unknown function (DUF3485)